MRASGRTGRPCAAPRRCARSTSGTTTSTSTTILAESRGGGAARSAWARRRRRNAATGSSRRRGRATTLRVFAKRAGTVDGELRFVADPPLIVPIHDLAPPGIEPRRARRRGSASLDPGTYRRSLAREHHPIEEYRYVDTARKVVGVGSVGTHAWIHLFVGRDDERPADPPVQGGSAVGPRAVPPQRARTRTDGQRVVVGQHLMQAATDIFLGWWRVRASTGGAATTTSASCTTGRAASRWRRSACRVRRSTPSCAGDAGARARALGRPDRDRLVPGQGRRVRPGDRRLPDGVRRSERAGLRGVRRRRRDRPSHRRDRSLESV